MCVLEACNGCETAVLYDSPNRMALMTPDSRKLALTIEYRSKHVPYPADSGDGRENQGFRILKGDPNAVDAVPEIEGSPALREALIAINGPETPFFTIGCGQWLVRRKGRFTKTGYLEFAFNYESVVVDAFPYFPVFFHFHRSTATQQFLTDQSTRLCWELQPVFFEKIGKAGFTCSVKINTDEYATGGKCEAAWEAAVRLVAGYLEIARPAKAPSSALIYGPQMKEAAN